MNPLLEQEYKQGLRSLFANDCKVVEINKREQAMWPDSPDMWVSTYGWQDYNATSHIRKVKPETKKKYPNTYDECEIIIPDGVSITEVSYSEFQDTFSDNKETIGINAYGGAKGDDAEIRCSCGKYRGMTLRYEGSLFDTLQTILGLNSKTFTL